MNLKPTYYKTESAESNREASTNAFLWLSIAATTSLFLSQNIPAGLLGRSLSMLLVGVPAIIGLFWTLEVLNRVVDQIGARQ